MKREQLEHSIRAARNASGPRRLFVVGSQSILAQHSCNRPPRMPGVVKAHLADRGVRLRHLAAMPIDAAARIERRVDAGFPE